MIFINAWHVNRCPHCQSAVEALSEAIVERHSMEESERGWREEAGEIQVGSDWEVNGL